MSRSKLGIEYAGGLQDKSTAFGGVGLLVELYRQSGASETAEQALPKKRSPRGLRQWQTVESLVLLLRPWRRMPGGHGAFEG